MIVWHYLRLASISNRIVPKTVILRKAYKLIVRMKNLRLFTKFKRGGFYYPDGQLNRSLDSKLPKHINAQNKLTILLPEVKIEELPSGKTVQACSRGTLRPSLTRSSPSSFRQRTLSFENYNRRKHNYTLINQENEDLINFKPAAKVINFSFKKGKFK